jgi:Fe-S-cluster containining protein
MPSDPVDVSDFFQCTQCGICCKGYGGTYVDEPDIAAIADYLTLPIKIVREKCCAPSGKRLVLAQRNDGYCIFWEQLCTIHPVKPLMCRRWPFIPSLLVDITNWQIMADSCPGIRPDVNLDALYMYAHAVIEGAGAERRRAYVRPEGRL